MNEEKININIGGARKIFDASKNLLKQKRVQWILVAVLLLAIIIFSSWMRVQNLPLLKDQTTGEYIPTALDPFYFLRLAETINEQGGLPEIDPMRVIQGGVGHIKEILPWVVVYMYKFAGFFGDYSIQFIDVISPVIFFALGLIVFFFLIYSLTDSKTIALLSTFFLSIFPPYLYRSMAGFSDHESLGMFAFFSVLLTYSLALKYLDKGIGRKNFGRNSILWALLVGFFSSFTIASWGGLSNFVFTIIPFSFGLFWLMKTRVRAENNISVSNVRVYFLFYFFFFVSSILFGFIYGFDLTYLMSKITLSTSSFINGVILFFILIDYALIVRPKTIPKVAENIVKKYRTLFSLGLLIFLGVILVSIYKGGFFNFISSLLNTLNYLLHPFGEGRVGLTVAENAQPSLNDWIGQIGKRFFWFFYLGMIFFGFKVSRGIKDRKPKILFFLFWILMISGILFSRISPSSIFNGTNFLSRLVYLGSLVIFFGYLIWMYFKKEFEINSKSILIFSWLIFMLIAGRGAVRLFYVITPFTCFMAGFFIVSIYDFSKRVKDDLLKIMVIIVLAMILIGTTLSVISFLNTSLVQAKSIGPSANLQWQNAMEWVRENTPEMAVFSHWWDYGYWVQYLGKRPTIADGGHFQGGFRDHLIGRYLLTTPDPKSALSFMKSNNVSYLLIDPTDLGKYGAYSRIGSDIDGEDRFDYLPLMLPNPSQEREEGNKKIRFYQGGAIINEDIIYNNSQNPIFLPSKRASLGAVFLELTFQEDSISFSQPRAIFVYNQKQIMIPVRYLYEGGEITDFGEGLDATIMIIPSASQNDQGVKIDNLGAAIYLSEKVSGSLFSQLYLLNDPFSNYNTLTLSHSEQDPLISNLNAQGANIGEFAYIGGFRGPIKIWEADYPSNVIEREEFLRTSGEYAEFDDLKVSN